MKLRAFQKRLLKAAFKPQVREVVFSAPRGNGKSGLLAYLCERALSPGDRMFTAGTESHLVSASLGQARRTTFRLLRERLDGKQGYKVAESAGACHVRHVKSNTRISVLPASSKGAMGLVRAPWVFADDVGSWLPKDGAAMRDALTFAQGKPDSPMVLFSFGTVAPAHPNGWWSRLCAERSTATRHVLCLQAKLAAWETRAELRRVNPLLWQFPESRQVVMDELRKAQEDEASKAAFLSYRCNLPTADESKLLIPLSDWQAVLQRTVPEREGPCFVGIDFGGARAWSAAVACWPNGRTEGFAMVGSKPNLAKRETRDRVPKGTYQRLSRTGSLLVQEGRRTVDPQAFCDEVQRRFDPVLAVADQYRFSFLADVAEFPLIQAAVPWRSHAEGIDILRREASDGALSVARDSQSLMELSLAVSVVSPSAYGTERITKSGDGRERDDVACAWLLALGLLKDHAAAYESPMLEPFVV